MPSTVLSSVLLLCLIAANSCSTPQEKYPDDSPQQLREARHRGRAQARADIKRDHLELRQSGLPCGWVYTYRDMLKDRLNVELHLKGCSVWAGQLAEDGAYNDVMTAEIQRRYGANALENLRKEAQTQWTAEHSDRDPQTRPAPPNV